MHLSDSVLLCLVMCNATCRILWTGKLLKFRTTWRVVIGNKYLYNLMLISGHRQLRRHDLLRGGGAKIEIMSWGTHGGLQGRVQQLLDD